MTNIRLGGVYVDFFGRTARFTRAAQQNIAAVRRQQRAIRELQATTRSFNRSVDTFVNRLSLIGVVAAGFTAQRVAAFGQTLATVRAITESTGQQFERLENQAINLGRRTRFTATQAAEGQLFLARAGFEVNEIFQVLPGTLRLAQAAVVDVGRAADIVTNIMLSFGAGAEDTSRFVDVLTKVANSSNTNLLQLADALKLAGSLASTLGLDIEQASAAVGVLSDAGLQATIAGTGLRQVFADLTRLSGPAETALNALGLTADDVSIELANLNTVSTAGLRQVITDIERLSGNSTAALERLGVSAQDVALAGETIEVSGRGLRDALADLETLSQPAIDALARFGLTAQDLTADGQGLITVIERLSASGATARDIFSIFDVRAATAFVTLQRNVDRLRELEDRARSSAGAAEELARIQDDTLTGAFLRTISAAEGFILTLDRISGASQSAQDLLDAVARTINAFVGLSPEVALTQLGLTAEGFASAAGTIDISAAGLRSVLEDLDTATGDTASALASLGVTAQQVASATDSISVAATGVRQVLFDLGQTSGNLERQFPRIVASVQFLFGFWLSRRVLVPVIAGIRSLTLHIGYLHTALLGATLAARTLLRSLGVGLLVEGFILAIDAVGELQKRIDAVGLSLGQGLLISAVHAVNAVGVLFLRIQEAVTNVRLAAAVVIEDLFLVARSSVVAVGGIFLRLPELAVRAIAELIITVISGFLAIGKGGFRALVAGFTGGDFTAIRDEFLKPFDNIGPELRRSLAADLNTVFPELADSVAVAIDNLGTTAQQVADSVGSVSVSADGLRRVLADLGRTSDNSATAIRNLGLTALEADRSVGVIEVSGAGLRQVLDDIERTSGSSAAALLSLGVTAQEVAGAVDSIEISSSGLRRVLEGLNQTADNNAIAAALGSLGVTAQEVAGAVDSIAVSGEGLQQVLSAIGAAAPTFAENLAPAFADVDSFLGNLRDNFDSTVDDLLRPLDFSFSDALIDSLGFSPEQVGAVDSALRASLENFINRWRELLRGADLPFEEQGPPLPDAGDLPDIQPPPDFTPTIDQVMRLTAAGRDLNRTFERFFEDVLTQTRSLSEAFAQLVDDLTRIAFRYLVIRPLLANIFNVDRFPSLFENVPALQTGGIGRGLTLVGERGPELVDFRTPSRVYSNEDTRGLLAGAGDRSIVFAPEINGGDVNALRTYLQQEAYPQFINMTQALLDEDRRLRRG